MVALPPSCTWPLVFLALVFFGSYRPSKVGVPLSCAPWEDGVGPGTSSEDRGGSPEGRGHSQR